MEVICWGCGKDALHFLENRDSRWEIKYFVDKGGQKSSINGYKICDVSELYKLSSDYVICTSTKYRESILKDYIRMGLDIEKFRFWDCKDCTLKKCDELWSKKIYSQDGEECYLKERFPQNNGIYVDVGAHHPYRFSNTYWAYGRGWTGINIEPNPDMYEMFTVFRPRDINLNLGIANEECEMAYYRFSEPALNTFSPKRAEMLSQNGNPIVESIMVEVRLLSSVLQEHRITNIDFINIDVETMEMEVLKSIDFKTVNIQCVLLEQLREGFVSSIFNTLEYKYLHEKGYDITSVFDRTVFYEKR